MFQANYRDSQITLTEAIFGIQNTNLPILRVMSCPTLLLAEYLNKSYFFRNFQQGFWLACWTTDPISVISDETIP